MTYNVTIDVITGLESAPVLTTEPKVPLNGFSDYLKQLFCI